MSSIKKQSSKPIPKPSVTTTTTKDKLKDKSKDKEQDNELNEEENGILSDPEEYLEENETLDLNLDNFHEGKKVWLVRLPKYLGDKWKDIDSLGGVELGKVRVKRSNGEMQLILNDNNNEDIPKQYDLTILNKQVKNEYIFNEKHLNKFKSELTEMSEMPEQPKLQPINKKNLAFKPQSPTIKFRPTKELKDGQPPVKKYIPYVKTIPKKTELVGSIAHDCQITPSKNDSKYTEILARRNKMKPAKTRPKVTFLDEIPGIIQSNAGPSIKGNNSSVFLRQNRNSSKGEGRAIRMPKKDLLDLLFRLFDEYEYWSMKGLKERTRQPESYLKESLDSISNLIKKGPYTSKYSLKPEYKRLRDKERAERLGIEVEGEKEDDNDDEEEEDVEMVDI